MVISPLAIGVSDAHYGIHQRDSRLNSLKPLLDVLNHRGRLFSERTAENVAECVHGISDLAYVATQVAEVSVHFVQCSLRLSEPCLHLILGRGQVLNRLLGVFDSITILAAQGR